MKIHHLIFSIILIFFISSHSFSTEKDYQVLWCEQQNGIIEYELPDKTRVDCLTDEYAIEVEFARKWYEAIGQSLYYSIMTGKKPGIALIVKNGDERYLKRLYRVSEKYNIRIWIIDK